MAPSSSRPSRNQLKKTQEAFAEACRGFIQELDTWVSGIESAFVSGAPPGSHVPSTPISLIKRLEDDFAGRLDDLTSLLPLTDDPAVLLNSIHAMLLAAPSGRVKAQTLDLFVKTAAPMWSMLRQWLVVGMPLPTSLTSEEDYTLQLDDDEQPIDAEFFIKRDRDVSWTDEDFWEAGYIPDPEADWPDWMGETRDLVLEAGKARGLLKGLVGEEDGISSSDGWISLRDLTIDSQADIAREIEGFLAPLCRIASFQLRRVLDEEYGLEQHLEAIEGVMLLRAHDTMDHYLSWLYNQVSCSP